MNQNILHICWRGGGLECVFGFSGLFPGYVVSVSILFFPIPHRWRGKDYFSLQKFYLLVTPMLRRKKRWDGLSRDLNPHQSVELHQTGTFRMLHQLSYSVAAFSNCWWLLMFCVLLPLEGEGGGSVRASHPAVPGSNLTAGKTYPSFSENLPF